jgi:hypothetical protein
MGSRQRQVEHERKRKARIAGVEDAMKALPLKRGAQEDIRKLSGLFEQTHYAADNRDDPATTRTMEEDLRRLAKRLYKVADQIQSLHGDALKIWAAAADPALNASALYLTLMTAGEWADAGVETLKRGRRIGQPGRREDLKSKWMRETAAFAYTKLTNRKDDRAWDEYTSREIETPWMSFLAKIFEIYGIASSAKSRA